MNRDLFLWQGQTRRKGEKVWMDGSPVDSKWVTGHGVNVGDGVFSIIYTHDPVEKHVVYTDTIRRFTGSTDKNGKKIFEGDILLQKTTDKFKPFNSSVWEKKHLVEFGNHVVRIGCADGIALGWYLRDIETNSIKAIGDLESDNRNGYYPYEVIGNKWDNPELLEEQE